jgi:hypothetical protein
MIIGISGVARSGKDTLANGFVEIFRKCGVKAKRYALADELKKEVKHFLQKNVGIDSFTQNDDDKRIIRPFLVSYGTHLRRKLNPDCWIEKLTENLKGDTISIVSDIRYENEAEWVLDQGGLLIHITRFNGSDYILPANEEETANDPILQKKSSVCFTWDTFGETHKENLTDYCFAFFEACFNMEDINKWQTTYPLSKRLNKTKTNPV